VQEAILPEVLVVDIGGNTIKVAVSGTQPLVRLPSSAQLTPRDAVARVLAAVADWTFQVAAIGYPGIVMDGTIAREPRNLGGGWVGFDFEAAFGVPVKIINDAAMQALGSYSGGRMLFLGLGTGMGAALIINGEVQPLELGHLPYKDGQVYEHFVGEAALQRNGIERWKREVITVIGILSEALQVDYVVLGGGNVNRFEELPTNVIRGGNEDAVAGGARLWANRHP